MSKTRLKCGCVPGAYWCSKHDIYSGNVPPWGAGEKRSKESRKVFDEELEYVPEACSCHLMAPCGFCERTQQEGAEA